MTQDNIPQTPEAIAYRLMLDIFFVEQKYITSNPSIEQKFNQVTSEDIMATFSRCLELVRKPDKFLEPQESLKYQGNLDKPRFF